MARCPFCNARLTNGTPHFCRTLDEPFYERSQDPQLPPPVAYGLDERMKMFGVEIAPTGLDKVTFVKKFSHGQQLCRTAAVLGYVSAGMTLIAAIRNFPGFINFYSSIGIIILLALSLSIQFLRSRIASVLLLAYALFDVITMLISFGEFGGWFAFIAGIFAIAGTFQCAREWKTYQARTQA